jgi:hypothetical protein
MAAGSHPEPSELERLMADELPRERAVGIVRHLLTVTAGW